MGQRIQADTQKRNPHEPVLLAEVLAALDPVEGVHVIDGTFGAGGYSRALLEAGARVTGIDRDPGAARHAAILAGTFADRFLFVQGRFSALDTLAAAPAGAVVLDIGVSSMQLDEAARGFSFLRDGPLDMRMDGAGPSAADLVNGLDERALGDLLFAYGEERKSRRIARAITEARRQAPVTTTAQLAAVIEAVAGGKPGGLHPATRSFQALRIAVNGEFEELVGGLFAAERVLGENGKLAVVTFHSLEDRIVKRFFSAVKTGSRHVPEAVQEAPRWHDVAKPVRPAASEIKRNPRARSATLRFAVRTGAPARPAQNAGLGVPGFAHKVIS